MNVLGSQLELFEDNALSTSNSVKTHKDFADCRYDATMTEIKIVLGLISLIRESDNEFRTFKFSITGLANYLGIQHKNRCPDVRSAIERLEYKKVILPEEGVSIKERPSVPWLSRCQISESRDFVELKLNPELAELLTDPEIENNYLAYQLAIVWQMKSTYSVKIYHLLVKHFWVNKEGKVIKNTFYKSIAELKELLKIPPDIYPLPGNFKDKVINIAQQECKKYADLVFEIKPEKQGRSIIGYNFIISKNEHYKPEKVELIAESSRYTGIEKYDKIINEALKGEYADSVKKLIHHKVTKQGIAEIIDKCTPEQIDYVVRNIEKASSKIKNIAGAIRQSCRSLADNQPSEYDRLLLEMEKEHQEQQIELEILLAENEAAATLVNNELVRHTEKMDTYIQSLSEQELNQVINEFLVNANGFLKNNFQQEDVKITDSISRKKLIQYLLDKTIA